MSMKSQRSPLSPEFLSTGILLKGRRECMCEAREHALINNCTNCGRIVCQQEGSGPCFTCHHLVCSNDEMEILNRDSKTSAKLLEKLMGDTTVPYKNVPSEHSEKVNQQLYKAIEHKNKLLEFNDTVAKRTKVIDDESDYFNMDSNKWLSASVRKAFEEKIKERDDALHGSRLNKKITFDFAGREIEEKPCYDDFDVDELLKDNTSIFECADYLSSHLMDYVPEYNDTGATRRCRPADPVGGENRNIRIQDKELQFMSDTGMCLSVNQPYASLLISGIKTHEGRNWYTSYRGRLWIRSNQRLPTKEDIDQSENAYRIVKGEYLKFPTSYPTDVVVGCVDLVECLTQEEYSEVYPAGEIASPFVLICENAQELKVKFPMKGGKKIFKMETSFHNAAKKTLQKFMQN